jgi:hypothetical protein
MGDRERSPLEVTYGSDIAQAQKVIEHIWPR